MYTPNSWFRLNIQGEYSTLNPKEIIHFISAYPLTIINIEQHDTTSIFSLDLTINLQSDMSNLFEKEISQFLTSNNAHFKKQPIDKLTHARDSIYTNQSDKATFIVTLLAFQLTSAHLDAVLNILQVHQLDLINITPLSRFGTSTNNKAPSPLKSHLNPTQTEENCSKSTQKICLELSMRGKNTQLRPLKKALLEFTHNTGIDIAIQTNSPLRRFRRLVVFDMDSTLIEAEVIDELASAAGVGAEVAAITEQAMRGEIDFDTSFKRRVKLLQGLSTQHLPSIARELRLTPGTERLIKHLKQLGLKTAIISGGFDYFGNFLQQKLGFDHVITNYLDIKNDIVTGEVCSNIINGEEKARHLTQIAAQEGISLDQVIAVGDGANDLPMLSIAGMGIAFRAKPLVKANAEHSISNFGLDAILYLMGFNDHELELLDQT